MHVLRTLADMKKIIGALRRKILAADLAFIHGLHEGPEKLSLAAMGAAAEHAALHRRPQRTRDAARVMLTAENLFFHLPSPAARPR